MAKRVEPITLGIDVSKATLEVAGVAEAKLERVRNEGRAIAAWLSRYAGQPLEVGLEPTGGYHEEVMDQLLEAGAQVYLVDPKRLRHYREGVGVRAKTDECDARLLRRYVRREREELVAVKALDPRQRRVWQLLKRRAKVVQMEQRVKLSGAGVSGFEEAYGELARQVKRLVALFDRELRALARALGWGEEMAQLRTIPGVGELNALALTASYHRTDRLRNSDSFVSYLGLDVRVRDSGQLRGRRKLTKSGEPELRRLLFNAARTFDRDPRYRAYRVGLEARGLSSTAAYVVIARKLVRVAFTVLRRGVAFDPNRFCFPCEAT